jgi:hypothetical protein
MRVGVVRAIVNCQRCYALASELSPNEVEGRVEKAVRDDQVWAARNEALRALEEMPESFAKESFDSSRKRNSSLNVCKDCDYSKPEIANILKVY